jgi:ABC-2 type transport system ATP-binding protein
MIHVENLRAGYRSGFTRRWTEVLRGLSFDVEKGSVTGYLGINGAGKTTTIKILVGVNSPREGSVTIGGHPASSPDAQRVLGYFPEAPYFYEGLSALELLEFFGRLHGLDRDARGRQAGAMIEKVGLEDAKDLPIRGYSKGMRQRLGLAQAMVHDPDVLILDEPLDGLDPMGRLQLRGLIAEQGERGATVFFSSHVLSDVEAISDHLVVLSGGSVAYQGSTQGLSDHGDDALVELRVGGIGEEATLEDVAKAAGAPLKRRGDGTADLVCGGQAAADSAIDAARAAGGQILSVISRRQTLEETFLERFGDSASKATPDKATPDEPKPEVIETP